jgi:hypothetical protein
VRIGHNLVADADDDVKIGGRDGEMESRSCSCPYPTSRRRDTFPPKTGKGPTGPGRARS